MSRIARHLPRVLNLQTNLKNVKFDRKTVCLTKVNDNELDTCASLPKWDFPAPFAVNKRKSRIPPTKFCLLSTNNTFSLTCLNKY